MTPDELKSLLESKIPDAQAVVTDMTGTSDHFDVHIVSPAFEGKGLLDQHRMVYDAVGIHMTTTVHALKIKTATPS